MKDKGLGKNVLKQYDIPTFKSIIFKKDAEKSKIHAKK